MSNEKINIDYRESTERYVSEPHKKRLKRVGRRAMRVVTSKAAKHVAVVTAGAALVYGGVEAATPDYEFDGVQPVQIDKVGEEDGTVREATFNHVDGVNGANIDETLDYIQELPRNENLRDADGMIVDTGATVYMPESVRKK